MYITKKDIHMLHEAHKTLNGELCHSQTMWHSAYLVSGKYWCGDTARGLLTKATASLVSMWRSTGVIGNISNRLFHRMGSNAVQSLSLLPRKRNL